MKLSNHTIPFGLMNISALHYQPDTGQKSPFLIYSHGFTSCKHSMDGIASYLAMKGFAGLTYDAVGHKLGGTGGELHSIKQLAAGCGAVAEYAFREFGVRRIIYVGHSMGAMASLEQASRKDIDGIDIDGVVSIAFGAEPARGFSTTVGKAMLSQRSDYIAGAAAKDIIQELNGWCSSPPNLSPLNMMFIAAKSDVLIPVERVQQMANLCGSDNEVTVIDSSHLEAPDKSRARIYEWLVSLPRIED